MSTPAELFRVALAALLVGVALPLLVQLFLTLRSLQKVLVVLDKRLDVTLRDLSDTIGSLRQVGAPASTASAIGAALVPAIVAGIRALRTPSELHPTSNGMTPAAHQEETDAR